MCRTDFQFVRAGRDGRQSGFPTEFQHRSVFFFRTADELVRELVRLLRVHQESGSARLARMTMSIAEP
ncbi:hypothetical protein DRQ53_10965 [bacterium]|nr:MAG: hypothetical protein DRQ53_10965 [bacterium]